MYPVSFPGLLMQIHCQRVGFGSLLSSFKQALAASVWAILVIHGPSAKSLYVSDSSSSPATWLGRCLTCTPKVAGSMLAS